MCYNKYYSIIMKVKIHISEICVRCMRNVYVCTFTISNNITNGLCPICTMYVHIFNPELLE